MADVENVQVTQADRNAAVRLMEAGSQDWQAKEIRLGQGDHFPIVQAFARHRLAALEASPVKELVGALEPFAQCGDSYADEQPDERQVIEREPGILVVNLGHLRRARTLVSQYREQEQSQ